jgi:site-specific DNA-methyltransferase (adenine-specific)
MTTPETALPTTIVSGLHCGDCLELMKRIADASVDMILCDLPYGTTYAAWDRVIPMQALWGQYLRIAKDDAAIVLTANQPFTSALVMSQPKLFRCEWVWDKSNASNFANAKRQPLKQHENVLVFSKMGARYFPQMTQGKPNHAQGRSKVNQSDTRQIKNRVADDLSGLKFPKTILNFPKHSSHLGLHPTQKPISLFEYLIRSYTREGELVLDNCIGSGTTAIAAINTNRQWIGMEQDRAYFEVARNRIAMHTGKGEG